eukprot:6491800-Pyramimonas_sp.AAC.1
MKIYPRDLRLIGPVMRIYPRVLRPIGPCRRTAQRTYRRTSTAWGARLASPTPAKPSHFCCPRRCKPHSVTFATLGHICHTRSHLHSSLHQHRQGARTFAALRGTNHTRSHLHGSPHSPHSSHSSECYHLAALVDLHRRDSPLVEDANRVTDGRRANEADGRLLDRRGSRGDDGRDVSGTQEEAMKALLKEAKISIRKILLNPKQQQRTVRGALQVRRLLALRARHSTLQNGPSSRCSATLPLSRGLHFPVNCLRRSHVHVSPPRRR